jgi:SAM-dependent methyltransferase
MPEPVGAISVPEPLSDLAWFAFDAAPQLCHADHGCLPYHRLWSLVRLVELGGQLPRGLDFFADGLAPVAAETGTVRVLVAGSADTGVPALVASAAHRAGLRPVLHVADRCGTPLAQIDRFAAQSGLEITTSQGNIADLAGGAFDAAVTHNVMGFNSPEGRRAFLAAIGRCLRPGGRLLSIETISEVRVPRVAKDGAMLAARFLSKLRACEDLTEARFAALRAAAEAHFSIAMSRSPYPEADLRADLSMVGLEITALDYRLDDSATSPRSQPSTLAQKRYAHIVAERRA